MLQRRAAAEDQVAPLRIDVRQVVRRIGIEVHTLVPEAPQPRLRVVDRRCALSQCKGSQDSGFVWQVHTSTMAPPTTRSAPHNGPNPVAIGPFGPDGGQPRPLWMDGRIDDVGVAGAQARPDRRRTAAPGPRTDPGARTR
ncbi:hypothetical protein MCNF_21030 [Mycolicibacterium confluentis]|uniref:Uncharacterized protein n=1 Tax=Mycolicibacterium confluentis TaxID=28047 RepID=A0A7I7XW48_9MYCO|nr:hypothetical protein MCNF_21030 [Mycolicibacterium confluentis]